MTRFLSLALIIGVLGSTLRAESFNPADAEPLLQDRALLLKLVAGTRQARLQVRNEAGAWEVFAVAHLAGDEGFLKMRLPDDVALEDCRAQVSMTDPFPYSFYGGQTRFEQEETGGFRVAGGGVAFDDAAGAPEADRDAGDGADQVQESDLWQWRGNTLYFFNQLRGLQVFDLSTPAKPVKLATLRMPAVGDQMYVLDDEHVLLLANYVNYAAYGWWDIALPYSSVQQTEAVVVKHSGEKLEVVSRVALDGDYVESRLVGKRLYLVTRLHQPTEDEEGGIFWKQGLVVNGIDLTQPAAPAEMPPLELIDNNGWFWNSVVTASPDHLLVTTAHYDSVARLTKSRVHVIPIGRNLATLKVAHTVALKANLPDKFKLRVDGDILTTVTQKNVWREELTTYVESFDLSGERALKLDELILAPQERLHATRFDGDRLYVVTFFVELRKDPLFVIDLSDPKNLKSLGELEIPGWSTYLVPEGDRLLSVGIEDNRVAISLFDVGNPAKLRLIQRVYPGEGRSWSEANWDEKAVGYLTQQDLLLLPIQTQQKGPNGYEYKNLMQIIDVHENSLEVRGAIEHAVQGRRATAVGTDIVSISGRELLVVDAENRDKPVVVAEEVLAWDAFKVLEVGDHLWQIGQGYSWNGEIPTDVRVTTKGNVDEPVANFTLAPGGVAGLYQEEGRLYVARIQQWSEEVAVPLPDEEIKPRPEGEPDAESPDGGAKPEVRFEWVQRNRFFTDVYDVSSATAPVLLGSLELDLGNGYQANGLDSVLGARVNGHLLWRPRIASAGHYGGGWFIDDVAFGGGIGIAADVAFPGRGGFYYGGYPTFDKVSLILVDVSDPAAPALASQTVIDPKDYAEFGPMLLRGDRLLLSYKESLYQQQTTLHRYELREVDFAQPSAPVVGPVVNIPGMLEGVHLENGGEILFTSAPKMEQQEKEEFFYMGSNSLLQASVYDGNQAFLVSEVLVPNGRFTSTTVIGSEIFKPGTDANKTAGLLSWQWQRSDAGGELVSADLIPLEGQPSNVAVHEGLLFADHNRSVSIVKDRRVTRVELSGAVHTQNLREVEVTADQSVAWLAVGAYGIEILDLSGLSVAPALARLAVAAQVEGWAGLAKENLFYVRASGNDYVGTLEAEESWRFRSSQGLVLYSDWAVAQLAPTGDPDPARTDPGADLDYDGFSNFVEFVYDTLSTDARSVPTFDVDIALDAQSVALSSSVFDAIGAKNAEAIVEMSRDLKTWKAVPRDAATGKLSAEAAAELRAFYRIRLVDAEAE